MHPFSFFLIWLPEQYTVRSTHHASRRYIVSPPPLPCSLDPLRPNYLHQHPTLKYPQQSSLWYVTKFDATKAYRGGGGECPCVNNSLDRRLGWPRVETERVVEDTTPLSCRKSIPDQVLVCSQSLNGQTINPSQQIRRAKAYSRTPFYIHENQTSRISKSSLFRDVMQRRFVPGYRHFWTTYRPHLQWTSSRNSYRNFGYKTRAWDDLILWSCGDKTNLESRWRQLAWLCTMLQDIWPVGSKLRHTDVIQIL